MPSHSSSAWLNGSPLVASQLILSVEPPDPEPAPEGKDLVLEELKGMRADQKEMAEKFDRLLKVLEEKF